MSIAAVGAMIVSCFLLEDKVFHYNIPYKNTITVLSVAGGLIIALIPLVVSAAVFLLKSLIVKRRTEVK